MNKPTSYFHDRLMGWALPAIAGLTPLVVVYTLVRPNVGQAYFFQAATLAAAAALGLAWLAGWRGAPERPGLPAALLALNALAVIASLPASQSPLFSLRQALLPGCALFFFALVIAQSDRARVLGRLRAVLTALAALLALYGILQYFGWEFIGYGGRVEKNRVIATIGHPNFLASVLGPLLFIVLSWGLGRRGAARKLAAGGAAALVALCLLLTRARGVWLGVALGLTVAALIGRRYCVRRGVGRRWALNIALGVMCAAVVLGIAIKVLPLVGHGLNMEQRLASTIEIKSRLYYWRTAVDMGLQRPVFGHGFAMFDPKFWDFALAQQKSPLGPYYYDILPTVAGVSPGHVHNEYLEVLAEQGFFGLGALTALLSFFLFFGYWALMRLDEPARVQEGAMVYGALVVILVDAFFSFPWRLPVSLMILAVVLAWLYDLIYPQPRNAESGMRNAE